jgi:cytochrome c peroxidase
MGAIASLISTSGCSSYYYWKGCVLTGHTKLLFCIPPPSFEAPVLFLDQPVPIPAANPQTVEKVNLGKKLFFDPILSKDGKVSCASCHQPEHGFAQNAQFSKGVRDQEGSRNAPALLNVGYQRDYFFDGRTGALEQQAREPLFNPLEMGNSVQVDEQGHRTRDKIEEVIERLKPVPGYKDGFKNAFGLDIETATPKESFQSILMAIAAYERTLTSTDSLFDQWVKDEAPIPRAAQRGWRLFFGKARCASCHTPPTYSDNGFHNIGIPRVPKALGDKGRASYLDQHPQSQGAGVTLTPLEPPNYEVSGGNAWEQFGMDACAYKTPSLRNVQHTSPYMHTGAFHDLKEVIAFYVRGGDEPPCGRKDWRIERLDLNANEQEDLLAFLKALSGMKVPAGVPLPDEK